MCRHRRRQKEEEDYKGEGEDNDSCGVDGEALMIGTLWFLKLRSMLKLQKATAMVLVLGIVSCAGDNPAN